MKDIKINWKKVKAAMIVLCISIAVALIGIGFFVAEYLLPAIKQIINY